MRYDVSSDGSLAIVPERGRNRQAIRCNPSQCQSEPSPRSARRLAHRLSTSTAAENPMAP